MKKLLPLICTLAAFISADELDIFDPDYKPEPLSQVEADAFDSFDLFSPTPSKFKPGTEPSGFRKHRWGKHFTNFPHLTFYDVYTNETWNADDIPRIPKYIDIVSIIKIYTNKNENLKIGHVKISLFYNFINNRLTCVDFRTPLDKKDDFLFVKNALFKRFGKPQITEFNLMNSKLASFEWKGKKTVIKYRGAGPISFHSAISLDKLKKKEKILDARVRQRYNNDIKNAANDF